MSIEEAVRRLLAAGLVVYHDPKRQPSPLIRGGIAGTRVAMRGVPLLEGFYHIDKEGEHWIVALPGRGQLAVETTVPSLENAVDMVIEFFADRSRFEDFDPSDNRG